MEGRIVLEYQYDPNVKICKCGSKPSVARTLDSEGDNDLWYVICKCGRKTAGKFARDKAVRVWNRGR